MTPSRTDDARRLTIPRGLALLHLVGGLVGLLAAAALLVEKINSLKDPDYVPTCSINPVLSCGSVMNTPQAEALGIPNPIIGVAGFAALAMLGALLLTGARVPRWVLWAAQAGVTFGIAMVTWLIWQSLYAIGALCPYCLVVWVVMIAVFVMTTVHTLVTVAPRSGLARRLHEYRGVVLTAWYLVVVVLVAERFWDYWSTLV